MARGYIGGLPLTPLSNESVISEVSLEIDSVTLEGTSSVPVFLFTFTQGGETYKPYYRIEIH